MKHIATLDIEWDNSNKEIKITVTKGDDKFFVVGSDFITLEKTINDNIRQAVFDMLRET